MRAVAARTVARVAPELLASDPMVRPAGAKGVQTIGEARKDRVTVAVAAQPAGAPRGVRHGATTAEPTGRRGLVGAAPVVQLVGEAGLARALPPAGTRGDVARAEDAGRRGRAGASGVRVVTAAETAGRVVTAAIGRRGRATEKIGVRAVTTLGARAPAGTTEMTGVRGVRTVGAKAPAGTTAMIGVLVEAARRVGRLGAPTGRVGVRAAPDRRAARRADPSGAISAETIEARAMRVGTRETAGAIRVRAAGWPARRPPAETGGTTPGPRHARTHRTAGTETAETTHGLRHARTHRTEGTGIGGTTCGRRRARNAGRRHGGTGPIPHAGDRGPQRVPRRRAPGCRTAVRTLVTVGGGTALRAGGIRSRAGDARTGTGVRMRRRSHCHRAWSRVPTNRRRRRR